MAPIIGWAGTAKNTGKTTALLAFLDELYRQGLTPGLTSIGLDGEVRDQVTGLTKPRFWLEKGTWVATAKGCLASSTAGIEQVQPTGIATALGEVIVARIQRPGSMILAGPSRGEDLRRIGDLLAQRGSQVILADGALGRITPFAAADGWILATGAARNTDMDALAKEALAIQEIAQLPLFDQELPSDNKVLISSGLRLTVGSILDDSSAQELAQTLDETPRLIWIPGAVHGPALGKTVDEVFRRHGAFPHTLLFQSPFHLLAGGQAQGIKATLNHIQESGGQIRIGRRIPLLAVTINPFFPAYQKNANRYVADSLTGKHLLDVFRQTLSVPVFDIKQTGATPLWHSYQSTF